MIRTLFVIVLLWSVVSVDVRGQTSDDGQAFKEQASDDGQAFEKRASDDGQGYDKEAPIYYPVLRDALMYLSADSSRPYVALSFREPLYVLEDKGSWLHIRTRDGAQGYVPEHAVSNVWIRVSKAAKSLYVYRGTELLAEVRADFGTNDFSDKRKRGSLRNPDDWRTPEGVFYVIKKNPSSEFYKALVLNYPTAEDAKRGRRDNLISGREYEAILEAEQNFRMPPMDTALGGWIEIHGSGTGAGINWTHGCVALDNRHIDQLWKWAQVGTPVIIE